MTTPEKTRREGGTRCSLARLFCSSSMWQSEFFSAEVGNCSSGGGASLSLWRRLRGLSDIRAPRRHSAVDTEKQTASVSCSLNLRDMLTFQSSAFKNEKTARTSKPTGMNGGLVSFIHQPKAFRHHVYFCFCLHLSVLMALDCVTSILGSTVFAAIFLFHVGGGNKRVSNPHPRAVVPPVCASFTAVTRTRRGVSDVRPT